MTIFLCAAVSSGEKDRRRISSFFKKEKRISKEFSSYLWRKKLKLWGLVESEGEGFQFSYCTTAIIVHIMQFYVWEIKFNNHFMFFLLSVRTKGDGNCLQGLSRLKARICWIFFSHETQEDLQIITKPRHKPVNKSRKRISLEEFNSIFERREILFSKTQNFFNYHFELWSQEFN